MIRDLETNKEIHPNVSINRMRYRGPIESKKIKKNSSDIQQDIEVLKGKFNTVRQKLIQYISETINGSKYEITIKENNEVIFNSNECESAESMKNEINKFMKELY